ncbi:MAG: response regulator [Chloroflexi bacterium]|nr:response regulator [Chloroflexota bacterium]
MAKILIIEDDPHSANIVQRVLSRRGHQVIHAKEGLTGLKMAGEESVDLVLLDLGLPDIGGHTIAALINRLPGDIPIVAVTGSTDAATQRRAMTYGCDGYITKPIDTRAFPAQIESFLNREEGTEDLTDEDDDAGEDTQRTSSRTTAI